MKMFQLAFLPFALCFILACIGQGSTCLTRNDRFGVISESFSSTQSKCWKIEVPESMYLRIDIKKLSLPSSYACNQVYLKIAVTETNETYTYCPQDNSYQKPITALSDVNITFSYYYNRNYNYASSFSLNYHAEDLICAQKRHFRCSNHTCIHDSKVCDGVKDCDSGADEIGCEKGVFAVKGLNASRENAIAWLLKNQQSVGKNIHRLVTALYLARSSSFRGQNLEEELMAKQLELQTSVALLRNSTDPLSVSELSMFANALSATCHDPRRFYGYDLVRMIGERVHVSTSPSPGAYLTLCNSNRTLSQSDIKSLLRLLQKPSKYPFLSDVQAVTVMALTCVKNAQGKEFTRIHNASDIYNSTVEKFISGQLSDGSFGNVYTTALITQALLASGQEDNPKWNVTSTIQYLMKQLNSSSVDFLSVYLALPVFSGKSLVDMAHVNCANVSRKQDEDGEISDVRNKLGGKMRVQYSLFVGDQKDVIHTIFLRMPEESSAYDVMRVAQVADPKYKFRHRDVSGHMYVYEIASIINDPEAGTFWLMYSEKSNRTIEHFKESPDKFIVDDEEHLIMWYKTAHV